MTIQLNLRLSEEFFSQAQQYAKLNGFLNIQELFREAAREKVFEDEQIKTEYLRRLASVEANTFLSDEESKKFERELKKRVK